MYFNMLTTIAKKIRISGLAFELWTCKAVKLIKAVLNGYAVAMVTFLPHANEHNMFTNRWVYCDILFITSIEIKEKSVRIDSSRKAVLKTFLTALLPDWRLFC